MTTAHLGLAIDSRPAVAATDDMDRMTASATKLEQVVVRMGSASSRSLRQTGADVVQLTDRIRQTAVQVESLAERINRALNVRTTFGGADRGKDIAEYGRQLDGLRGKFNPVFATLRSYKSTLEEIRQAHRLGAISADEMATAIARERQAALSSVAALKGRNQALNQGGAGGDAASRRQNLGYQAFDIGQGLASGMPLQMIAAQQGPQVAQLYAGQGGAKALLADVSSAATGLIATVGALPLALGAAGTAAILYAKRNEVSLASADKVIEKHRTNIESLADAYGVAERGAEAYQGADRAVANAATRGSLEEVNKLQVQAARELRLQFGSMQTPGKGGQAFFNLFPN